MIMNDDKKQKRNKPCENCRAHRRKCKVSQGNDCDRCIKMSLTCVFKFTAKPSVTKKDAVSVSKKNKMMDQVRFLEQAVAEMEQQLQCLSVHLPKKSDHHPSWQLMLHQNAQGMRLQTSIQSVADLLTFFKSTLHSFIDLSPSRTPNYHIDRSLQRIHITHRMLLVETILHSFFFRETKRLLPRSSPHTDARRRFKVQMIHAYFDCFGKTTPTFVSGWFRSLFAEDPDSMVSSALAAYVTYIRCIHVVDVPGSHEALAESFRQEAKALLMLEEAPSIYAAATLMFLAQCGFIMLENQEARHYLHMAWQMILELRDEYIPHLANMTKHTLTEQGAMAESFRRLFYTIRYLEININIMYDDLRDYSSILCDYGLGLPVLLPGDDCDAIDVFRYIVILHVFQMSGRSDNLKFQLFAGSLESICILDIEQIENQLVHFWKSLPPAYRISDAPLEYVQMERIENIKNPYAVYMNHLYYCYWLTLETRLMPTPSSTDLMSANLDRLDGDRALLIVSISCDAVAKLTQVLYCKLPCTLELHWLMIACDAMALLGKSQNVKIRERAQANLVMTLGVLEKCVDQQTSKQDDYFGEFKKALFTYFNCI